MSTLTGSLNMGDLIARNNGFIVSDMQGEKVMLSVSQGKYYNLGQIGGDIWELLASPATVASLVASLMEQYEVDEATCMEHVRSFLENLQAEGMICVQEKAGV